MGESDHPSTLSSDLDDTDGEDDAQSVKCNSDKAPRESDELSNKQHILSVSKKSPTKAMKGLTFWLMKDLLVDDLNMEEIYLTFDTSNATPGGDVFSKLETNQPAVTLSNFRVKYNFKRRQVSKNLLSK